ncbi:MAG: hypothetical protein Q9178_006213 [Gyalolechia marmorata]
MAQVEKTSRSNDNGLASQRHQIDQAEEKVSQSIKYWQSWGECYKDLREALQNLGGHASRTAIEEVGSQSVGPLLNEKEIDILLRDEKNGPRTAQQVIGVLSRRIEYVESNIKSFQSQVKATEATSEASNRILLDDAVDFPLMEIQEELDEDDNVISSTITPASAAAPKVVEALRKAGISGLPNPQQEGLIDHQTRPESNGNQSDGDSKITSPILKQTAAGTPKPLRDQQPSPSTSESDSKGEDRGAGRRRKSVTFADGTKQAPPTSSAPRSARDVQAAKAASTARRIKAEVRGSVDALKKVHSAGFISDEVFDRFRQEYVERLQIMPPNVARQLPVSRQAPSGQENKPKKKASTADEFNPVLPSNESAEDAALRREMIRYNMSEVGAVVAEMNLDDDDQSDHWDSVDSNTGDEDRHSSDEDENGWGMVTSDLLNSDYINQMKALERKLSANSARINGSSADINTILQAEKDLEIGQDGNPTKRSLGTVSKDQGGKAVRFANSLDVQEPLPLLSKAAERREPRKPSTTPVHADIVERPTPVNGPHSTNPPTSKKKASRFKSSFLSEQLAAAAVQHPPPLQMQVSNGSQVKTPSLPAFTPPATPKMTPTGPPGRTHTADVVEHPFSDGSMDRVTEPDEFDAALLQQEVRMGHHRTRNRMIQRQGGFLANEEEEEEVAAEGPVVDQNGKKISRFKAARLKAPSG